MKAFHLSSLEQVAVTVVTNLPVQCRWGAEPRQSEPGLPPVAGVNRSSPLHLPHTRTATVAFDAGAQVKRRTSLKDLTAVGDGSTNTECLEVPSTPLQTRRHHSLRKRTVAIGKSEHVASWRRSDSSTQPAGDSSLAVRKVLADDCPRALYATDTANGC